MLLSRKCNEQGVLMSPNCQVSISVMSQENFRYISRDIVLKLKHVSRGLK
jgi:hypothetical protein